MQHADQISIKNGESLGVKKGNAVSMHICGIQCLLYGAVNHLGVSNYSMFTWLIGSYIEITLHCEFYNMEFHYWIYISCGTVKMASSHCLYLEVIRNSRIKRVGNQNCCAEQWPLTQVWNESMVQGEVKKTSFPSSDVYVQYLQSMAISCQHPGPLLLKLLE